MISHIDPSPDFADEVVQVLLERLLVSRPGEAPTIADYSGRGALGGWLRIVAVRTCYNLRCNRDAQPVEDIDALAARGLPAGVNRSTVVRWLADVREALFKETRRLLRERLRLNDSEFESLMGLVRSDLDLSISIFLTAPE
jgi:RNA polymerase sigma-70 factor (ECF subfamily)